MSNPLSPHVTGSPLSQEPGRSPAIHCHLCGLPVKGTDIPYSTGSGILHFCCHGCQQVFLLLSAATGVLPEGFRETELYRVCVEAGIIPASGPQADAPSGRADINLPPLELSCVVDGMWCPSCAWLIEQVLGRMAGVSDVKVSFVSDRLRLSYLPHIISPTQIVSRIGRLGYQLTGPREEKADEKKKDGVLPLCVSAFLTANIMMASVFFYGFFDLPQAILRGFSYPILVMTSFVLFWAGLPILKRGLASLTYGAPSMDTLISIGALSAYLYSVSQIATGGLHLYFDTSSMLITLVLYGRFIETRARRGIHSGMLDLYQISRGKVRIARDGRQAWLPADIIKPGQHFTVLAGETVPLDSRIIDGYATIDESLLTGEAVPRERHPGDMLRSGSTVRDGEVKLEAIRTASEGLVGKMIAAIENALEKKDAYERLADRIGRFFVPVVLAISAGTAFFVWTSGSSAGEGLLRGLTVLFISCPCTLGIAIPLVKVAAVASARRTGVILRDPDALERMHAVDTIVFDKTGTLTEGNFSLQQVVDREKDLTGLFSRLASVEVHSRHFIGRQIVGEAARRGAGLTSCDAFRTHEGLGVTGIAAGSTICIGNRALMETYGMALDQAMDREAAASEKKGSTCVFFAWDQSVRGFLVFGDSVRKGAKKLITELKARGIEVWLVSGDAEPTTGAIAYELGIDNFRGRVLPDGKAELIETLLKHGRRVAMIGDGINDAPALAGAQVGCAFGAGADLIRETADITFLFPDPGKLLGAFELSTTTRRTIWQNLVFAFSYNAVAIPLAAMGILNPFIAVIAMVGSSLTVTGNALRVSRPKNPRPSP